MYQMHPATVVLAFLSAAALGFTTGATKLAQHCPKALHLPGSLTNTSPSTLPSLFESASGPQDPTAIAAIKNVLALYPLAIDGKDFNALSQVFTTDTVANYSAPLNVLTPLSTIESTLQASLAAVTTQHSYGTQIVQLFGPCVAQTVTYYRAAQFGVGLYEGEVLYAYGQYRDILVLAEQGWRIKERTLAYMVCFRTRNIFCMECLLIFRCLGSFDRQLVDFQSSVTKISVQRVRLGGYDNVQLRRSNARARAEQTPRQPLHSPSQQVFRARKSPQGTPSSLRTPSAARVSRSLLQSSK